MERNMAVIVGGYHPGNQFQKDFYPIWEKNVKQKTDLFYVISTTERVGAENEVFLNKNHGHVGDLINEKRDGLCGWSVSVLLGAAIAYGMDRDFIYQESDCLTFGPVIDQMYKDLGEKKFIFGAKMDSAPWMPCAQALFLIKHDFIPQFLKAYTSLPSDRVMLPEDKFVEIERQFNQVTTRLSFGCDRERPIPFDSKCFYVQQIKPEELEQLNNRFNCL